MSSGSRRSVDSRSTDDEINDLIFKLQALLPQLNSRRGSRRLPASEILKEACAHIRKLQREMDNLSQRLSQLLDSVDINTVDLESLANFLLQL